MPAKDRIDWKGLLTSAKERTLVTVVGPGALQMVADDGSTVLTNLYRQVAAALAGKLRFAEGADVAAVAAAYLEGNERDETRRLALYRAMLETLEQQRAALQDQPDRLPLLEKLVAIRDLRLFLTITPDDRLADALARAGRAHDVQAYRRGDPSSDLRIEPGDATVVYHLFGRLLVKDDPRPETAAAASEIPFTEADMLEHLRDLQRDLDDQRLPRLRKTLERGPTLFLGCGLPDWLMRLFVRTLRVGPFQLRREEDRAERLVEASAAPPAPGVTAKNDLVVFLERYGVQVHDGTLDSFLDDLGGENEAGARGAAQVGRSILFCCADVEGDKEAVARVLEHLRPVEAPGPARDAETRKDPFHIQTVPFTSTTYGERLKTSSVAVTVLSEHALRDKAQLKAHWTRIEARRLDGNAGAFKPLLWDRDGAARDWRLKGDDRRGWPNWDVKLERWPVSDSEVTWAWRLFCRVPDALTVAPPTTPVQTPSGDWRPALPLYVVAARKDLDGLMDALRSPLVRAWRQFRPGSELALWTKAGMLAGTDQDTGWKELQKGAAGILLAMSPDLESARDELEHAVQLSPAVPIVPIRLRTSMDDSFNDLRPFPPEEALDPPGANRDRRVEETAQVVLLRVLCHWLSRAGEKGEP